VNYLGLLGWSPPDGNETFTMDHMVEAFALGDVNNSPAFFDVAKLTHMNGEYLRSLGSEAFIAAAQPWLHGDAVPWSEEAFDEAVFARMAPLVQERVAILSEVPGMVDFLFLDEAPMDEADWTKVLIADTEADAILQAAHDAYAGTTEWTAARLHEITLQVAETAGKKLGKAQAPIRVAITGRKVGPPLFEALEVLGKEKTLARLKSALDSVGVHQAEDRTESG
jgi:glutamyl-tRNA synthetase